MEERKSLLESITPAQVALTGGALLTSGIIDVAAHNPTTTFIGLLVAAGVARHSKDILGAVVLGSDAPRVVNATARFIGSSAQSYADQSVAAKLKRMIGLKTPALAEVQEMPEEEVPELEESHGGVFQFSSVLRDLTPSLQRIYLGELSDGIAIYSDAKGLCHVALAGATGGGKCLEENEPVFLADGRIMSAKSLIGKTDQVVGVADTQSMKQIPVSASFSDNGVRTVIEIELDNGVVLKRTEEHPLWVARLDENQHVGLYTIGSDGRRRKSRRTRAINAGWVEAKDLRVCGNRPNFDGHVILCPIAIGQQGTISRPDADVILCAALLAEGTLKDCAFPWNRTPQFTNADPEMVALVKKAASQYNCELVPNIHKDKPPITYRMSRVKYPETYVYKRGESTGYPPNLVVKLIQAWGICGLATQKTIPDWVFQLPDEQIALFLRIFIDCDGWFDGQFNGRSPAVNVSLANAVLVQQIGQLALRLGIAGTYRHKENGHAGAWTWSSPMVDVWQERIGSIVKAEALSRAVQEKQRRNEIAATDWDAWRQSRPLDDQTFADCPDGYEWRKVVSVRRIVAPTVSIEVHNDNHAFVGYVVEHNTSIIRLLMSQLCKAGASVLLLNPHYTDYDLEADEDWTPFKPYLVCDPMEARRYEAIEHYLAQVATVLLPKRLDKYAHSQPTGKPYFLVIDELPAIVAHVKQAPEYLAAILREGRKVGIFLVTAAQDFLVKTIAPQGGGAIRDCYRTAFYVGGDPTTARILLDMPANQIHEDSLGQGTVMMRSKNVKQAQLAYVPYVDNEALYRLLGPSTYTPAISVDRENDLFLERLWYMPEQTASIPGRYDVPRPMPVEHPTNHSTRSGQSEIQRALAVYEPGMSYRDFGRALGIGKDKAGELMRELKERRLIVG